MRDVFGKFGHWSIDIFARCWHIVVGSGLAQCAGLAALAQLVEHLTCNHEVSGSNPGGGSTVGWTVCYGEFPERSNGADCKSVGSAFEGSNPPLPKLS